MRRLTEEVDSSIFLCEKNLYKYFFSMDSIQKAINPSSYFSGIVRKRVTFYTNILHEPIYNRWESKKCILFYFLNHFLD